MTRRRVGSLLVLASVALLLSSMMNRPRAATTEQTLAVMPVGLQRTWYHYDDNGQYDTVTFNQRTFATVEHQSGRTYHNHLTLHQQALGLNPERLPHQPTWGIARQRQLSGVTWLNVRSWNQLIGTGWDFRVTHQTITGRSVTSLNQTSSLGTWTYEHYFTSRILAKKYQLTTFSGEVSGTLY